MTVLDRLRALPGLASGRRDPATQEVWRQANRPPQPAIWEALVADARTTAAYRVERFDFRSRGDALVQVVRLLVASDALLPQACYRCKARWQSLGIPLLPRLAHRMAMLLGQVTIGDPVVIAPGVYLLHGQVVIDGKTSIGAGVRIAPFVTIGLRAGSLEGPTIGSNVTIGTGAKILGNVQVGNGAIIGANAVVVSDVPAGATAMGVPARVLPAGPA